MNETEIKNLLKPMIEKYLPTLKANNNADKTGEGLFSSTNIQNNTFVKIMDDSEQELFDAPVKYMLNQKIVSENYSKEFIQKKFVEIYHKILTDESKTDDYINEFVASIIPNIKDFFVASEIENIRIMDDQEYILIDSTIKIMKENDLPFKEEKVLLLLGMDLTGKKSIFTKVRGGETEKVKEYALHNFMVSFNLLKLYAPHFKPTLKGCLLSGNQELIVYDETEKRLSTNLSKVGELLLKTAYLNKEVYKQLKEAGIDELRNVNTVSKVVKECLYWFGLGLDEKYPSAKLLNFVTVLESTLKRKNELTELRKTVSERGAILLCNRFEERKKVSKQLKEIYDTRSKVVHTGVLIDNKDLASLSGGYARAVLIKLIKMSKNFKGDFDEFITYLDDMKLRGELPNA